MSKESSFSSYVWASTPLPSIQSYHDPAFGKMLVVPAGEYLIQVVKERRLRVYHIAIPLPFFMMDKEFSMKAYVSSFGELGYLSVYDRDKPFTGLSFELAKDICVRHGGRLPRLDEWFWASVDKESWQETDGHVPFVDPLKLGVAGKQSYPSSFTDSDYRRFDALASAEQHQSVKRHIPTGVWEKIYFSRGKGYLEERPLYQELRKDQAWRGKSLLYHQWYHMLDLGSYTDETVWGIHGMSGGVVEFIDGNILNVVYSVEKQLQWNTNMALFGKTRHGRGRSMGNDPSVQSFADAGPQLGFRCVKDFRGGDYQQYDVSLPESSDVH